MQFHNTSFGLAAFLLGLLFPFATAGAEEPLANPLRFELPKVDEKAAKALGIRKISSKHLDLYTDLPASPAVDELPKIFDLAVPQWCQYMDFDPAVADKWRLVGCLISKSAERVKFEHADLVPAGLPKFPDGLQRGPRIWWYEQESDYFRRHLMLHEGTHAFFEAFCGGLGPSWYAEGMADMMGTHSWTGGKLTLNILPPSKTEYPYWGRIKLVRDDVAAGVPRSLSSVIHVGNIPFGAIDTYSWSWGACVFFDHDPARRKAFRQLVRHVDDPLERFAQRVFDIGDDPGKLSEEWQVFASELDYGYDVARSAMVHKKDVHTPVPGDNVEVAANRGWQSTGWQVKEGFKYQLTATGRYQVAKDSKPWISEPDGVTLRYVRGIPLGQLQAAISTTQKDDADSPTPLLSPVRIGSGREWVAEYDGILYVRINDSPAERADNDGHCTVTITPVR
jgi:hypothetical protein